MAMSDTHSSSQPVIAQRWYLAITVLLPWLVVLLLEAGLRVGGYGEDYSLFVASPDHPGYLVPNQEVGKRYFGGAFLPVPQLDFFRAKKQPGTFRIVFQGESSAIGFPYMHGAAPARMLGQRLQATFPSRNIEVINTALIAVDSYTLLDFANEIIAQHPDAVMIYAGHNEYYGPFGAGSARGPARNRHFVRAWLLVHRLRIAQLLSNILTPRSTGDATPSAITRNVMEVLAHSQRVSLRSARYQAGLEQFRSNISDLLERYRSHGIPVFIATIASNERDQPPFFGADAKRSYADARAADSSGDRARAASLYRAAKEQDRLRLRAPEAINQIIREEAARHGAQVVESELALKQASPQGIVGNNVMLDQLHPNIDGYFLIANSFFEAMKKRGMIGSWTSAPSEAEAKKVAPVTAVDSVIGVYYADWLKSGWPFMPRGQSRIPIVDTLHARSPIERLAKEVVRQEVSWDSAMDELRRYYCETHDSGDASHTALVIAQGKPWSRNVPVGCPAIMP